MIVTPYKNISLTKKEQVRMMFDNISNRYDFLNHFLSMGIDSGWRKKMIDLLEKEHPEYILDIATGTGEVAIEAARIGAKKITGIDISEQMLEIGKRKIQKKNLQDKIELRQGDSENIHFKDNTFDAITVAFGVRNFENLKKGLKEMNRVLKPGGTALILEFSHPEMLVLKQLFMFYSKIICPFIGKIISKDKTAYSYLHESVMEFPSGNDLKLYRESGFAKVDSVALTFGITTIYIGKKDIL